jgi:hypothetical protein
MSASDLMLCLPAACRIAPHDPVETKPQAYLEH